MICTREMKRAIFILLSALFFIFMAVSLKNQMCGKGFGRHPIPTNITISLAKPEGLIPEPKASVFIQFFNTFCSEIEEPLSASSLYSPPISISHGAVKIPNYKYLSTNSAIVYILVILPRSSSNSDPLPA